MKLKTMRKVREKQVRAETIDAVKSLVDNYFIAEEHNQDVFWSNMLLEEIESLKAEEVK